MSWFNESINNDRFTLMLKSLVSGDIEIFEDILSDFVIKSVSYFDTEDKNESFYHALVLGMLTGLSENIVNMHMLIVNVNLLSIHLLKHQKQKIYYYCNNAIGYNIDDYVHIN